MSLSLLLWKWERVVACKVLACEHFAHNFRGFSTLSLLLEGIFAIGQNWHRLSIGPHVCLKGRVSISFTLEMGAGGCVQSVSMHVILGVFDPFSASRGNFCNRTKLT